MEMTKTDINGLLAFLSENAENDKARGLVAGLKPLMDRLAQIAKSGKWPLSEEVSADRLAQIASDLTLLVEKQSLRCVKVSLKRPFCKPDWMTENDYKAICSRAIMDSLRNSISCDSLRNGFFFNLVNRLGPGTIRDIASGIQRNLWDGLKDVLIGSPAARFHGGVVPIFADLILFGPCLAVLGDDRTERVVRITWAFADGVMPLGLKTDAPNTIIVLVA